MSPVRPVLVFIHYVLMSKKTGVFCAGSQIKGGLTG